MCGRFAQIYDDSALKQEFQLEDIRENITNRFNISPGMEVNTIIGVSDKNSFVKQHWGINSIHGRELDNLVFNTRSDTFIKDRFGKHFHKTRCIIPVSGFFEWNNKQPYFVKSLKNDILSLAGVFILDRRTNEYSCSVMTVNSIGQLSNIHERMPLILSGYDKIKWLNNSRSDVSDLENICLKRIDTTELDIFRVTDRVNSLLHDSPQCIEKLNENSLL
ncbi:MAG: SOS response-associated peptidase [Candidatus Delongbacteria bacterium]|nr:SOS response-associated peptidase [Candidatus Delongbacteria bacterium]